MPIPDHRTRPLSPFYFAHLGSDVSMPHTTHPQRPRQKLMMILMLIIQPALAQRTLSARSPLLSTPTQIPPKGHLTAPLLINLLDRLKTLPANGATTSKAVQDLYAQFNMSKDSMDVLRRYVNSPSVGEDVVRVEEGERIVEMRAVWVDGAGAGAERETERIA